MITIKNEYLEAQFDPKGAEISDRKSTRLNSSHP